MSNDKFKILLVEDDENLGFIIQDLLTIEGYSVSWEKNGKAGLKAFADHSPHLSILDVMMPEMDGFSLAEEIKKINSKTPVVFLTARSMENDRVKGFQLGADDYITKPFSNKEFLLRVSAILQRCYSEVETHSSSFTIGAFEFNPEELTLNHPSELKKLTKREAEILKLLALQMNSTVQRETILKVVWGSDDYFAGRSLDVFITKLRKYLSLDSCISITNVHGVGFKLEVSS